MQALVYDPSGFIDDYPVVPATKFAGLSRAPVETGVRSCDGDTLRVDSSKYPNDPAQKLLLV